MTKKAIFSGLAAAATALALGGCVTEGAARALGFETDPEIRAFKDLRRNSSVQAVSKTQVIVDAWGAPRTGLEAVELRLLARAADATYEAGFERFGIIHIRDRNLPLAGGIFNDGVFGSDIVWIGSYESLVSNRYERDQAFALRAWLNPGLTAIVQFIPEDDPRFDDAFVALDVYDILNREEMP